MPITAEMQPPTMPNFIKLSSSALKDDTRISVSLLSDDEVEEFIAIWSEAFREHARKRRELHEKLSDSSA